MSITAPGIAVARALHSKALKLGTLSDVHEATRILNAYSKSGSIANACGLFDEFTDHPISLVDVVCWNSIISACVHNGRDAEAFRYFKQMHYNRNRNSTHHNSPDSFTLSSILSSAHCLEKDIGTGHQLHGYVFKTGIVLSLSVGNALITLYSRWGRLPESRLVFECLPTRNVVSWTALISGHAKQWGHEEDSLKLFVEMLRGQNSRPNEFTFASIFSSCGTLASSSQGIPFIALALKMGLLSNIHVQNSLVGFYSECGWIEQAKATFEAIPSPDIVSWNSLLKGYSQQGMGVEALRVFDLMKDSETPDTVTFLSTLSACRHTGMVAQGLDLFNSMKLDYALEPQSEHISCIVDLLGRAGQLHKAQEFIKGMQFEPSASVWRTLLGACRLHGQAFELAELAASKLLELEPYDSEAYIVLSHVYAANRKWDRVKALRLILKNKGKGKEPGVSWIELHNKVHSFVAADWGHPEICDIQTTLTQLTDHTKERIALVPLY